MNPLVALIAKHDLLLAVAVGVVAFLALASLQIGIVKSTLVGATATILVIFGITEILPMLIPSMHVYGLTEILSGIKH